MKYGPWVFALFKILKRMKFLRGTLLDPFGYTQERKMERRLIAEYRSDIMRLLENLTPDNHALAVEIASLPQDIRGFGPVKMRNLASVQGRKEQLFGKFFQENGAIAAAE